MLKTINTPQAPQPIGPYSQAVEANGTFYLSGQIALIPATGEMNNANVEAEAGQVLKNLEAVLKSQSLGFENVVKTDIYLTDIADFGIVNQVYAEFMGPNKPARATVQVAALPKGAKVEIGMVAVR